MTYTTNKTYKTYKSYTTYRTNRTYRTYTTYIALIAIIAAFFHAPMPARAAGLAKPPNNLGLVGYWPLNDGTGLLAGDVSGYGYSGNMVSGAAWGSGKRGGAASLDGVDDYIDLSNKGLNTPSLYGGVNGKMTFSAWIKPTRISGVNYDTIARRIGGFHYFAIIGDTGNRQLRLMVYDGVGAVNYWVTSNSEIPANQWTHIVFELEGGVGARIYINGVLDVNISNTNLIIYDYGSDSALGGRLSSTENFFQGQIDDVRVYNRALSATEVTALYQSGQVTRKSVSNQGLVGYWAMNDGTGTTVGDSSGNGYNGFFSGPVSWATGKHGGAIDFAGGNINSNNSTPFNFGNNSFSVGAWFKLHTTTSYKTIVSKGGFWANDEFVLYANSGVLYFYVDKGGVKYYTPTVSLATDVWYHAFGVYDGSNINLYLNGAFVGQTAVSNLNIGNATNLRIGSGGGGSDAFDGLIDDVRVYNRALSATEIAALYAQNETKVNASTNSKMTDGLVGLWSFDGPDVSGSLNYDRSGNSRNATSTGSPVPAIGKIGQAMNFTGSGQYAIASGFSEPGTSNQPYTFAAWVKPATTETTGNIIHMSSRSDGLGWCLPPLTITGNKAKAESWNGGQVSVTGTADVPSNTWTHVATTWDATGGLKIYVNGVLDNSTPQAVYQASGLSNYIWMAYSTGSCSGDSGDFDGSVDDVRIYSRALTAAEIYRLYTLGK